MSGAGGTNGWFVTTNRKMVEIELPGGDVVEGCEWLVRDPGNNLVGILVLHPDIDAGMALVAGCNGLEFFSDWDSDGDKWGGTEHNPQVLPERNLP